MTPERSGSGTDQLSAGPEPSCSVYRDLGSSAVEQHTLLHDMRVIFIGILAG